MLHVLDMHFFFFFSFCLSYSNHPLNHWTTSVKQSKMVHDIASKTKSRKIVCSKRPTFPLWLLPPTKQIVTHLGYDTKYDNTLGAGDQENGIDFFSRSDGVLCGGVIFSSSRWRPLFPSAVLYSNWNRAQTCAHRVGCPRPPLPVPPSPSYSCLALWRVGSSTPYARRVWSNCACYQQR